LNITVFGDVTPISFWIQMTILQPSSLYPYYPEDGSSMSLRNIIRIPNYVLSHSGSCRYGSHLKDFKSHKNHVNVGP